VKIGDEKVNCAGQGCPERDGCRRFVLRLPTGGHKQFDWASFDIERMFFGDCLSFVEFKR
jgi:hypothetical protein